MTRRPGNGFKAVRESIDKALSLGVENVKINVVVIRGLNDKEDVLDFVRFTKELPVTVRFIEVSFKFFGSSRESLSPLKFKNSSIVY